MSAFAAIYSRTGIPLPPERSAGLAAGISRHAVDGQRTWRQEPVLLAHAHFWTTPEQIGESQPIGHPSGCWLSADLRLDNRDELCAQLGGAVDRRMASDAEILLAAYERWGEDCPRHLVGDFAFVLWDQERRRLFAARDVLGVRPFYYALDPRWLIAASTLEAVLRARETPVEVNEPLLADLLVARFERWRAETPYRGVVRLPAAHRLVVDAERAQVSRYWTLGEAPPPRLPRDEEQVERFREVFLTAVRATLRSTSPVGVMLSGGLDSSAVTCAAHHLLVRGAVQAEPELRLYSCVFSRSPAAQELEYAAAVARQCERAHTTLLPSDDYYSLREFGEDDGYPLDEPEISVSRALALRPLRALRADGCRVVVSGFLGDQVLGAEPYHRPQILRDVAWSRVAAELPHFLRCGRTNPARLAIDAYLRPAVPEILRRLLRRPPRGTDPRAASHLSTHAARLTFHQLASGRFAAALAGLSTSTAFVGVESRSPFQDRRLIELLLALPTRLRFGGGLVKLVLRRALGDLLPGEVAARTTVAHFGELENRGLREQRRRVHELLTGSRVVAAGWLSARALHQAWDRYWARAETVCSPATLIGFLCVEAWLRARETAPPWAAPEPMPGPATARVGWPVIQ